MVIHKIKSRELAAKGERIEGIDKGRIQARLAEVKVTLDPDARILSIPVSR